MAAAVESEVGERREGQLFLPILEAVLEIGAEVGLLAWVRSRGFDRVWDRV